MGTEPSDLSWEEIELEMAKESNMTPNALFLMAIAGGIAAGIVTRNGAWRHGLLHIARGYAALIAGAIAATLLLLAFGTSIGAEDTYLAPGALVSYWTTISPPGLLVSALAGAAGALPIASDRSVLTAGVLISLALIPSATLVGMALIAWDPPVLGRAVLRWLIDVALVAVMAVPVLVWHGRRIGRRASML